VGGSVSSAKNKLLETNHFSRHQHLEWLSNFIAKEADNHPQCLGSFYNSAGVNKT